MRTRAILLSAAALLVGLGFAGEKLARAQEVRAVPAPLVDAPTSGGLQSVVLSGGCFWGVQGVFEHVKGVTRAVAGYSGGAKDTAAYERVSTGTTGHAESVQVTFDPSQISYGRVLQIFFSVALDPTEVNRQGPDSGTQYRSEIFFSDATQQRVATAYIAQLDAAHVFDKPIATRVDKLTGFFPAETYHQDFLVHNPTYPYIVFNDVPKVEALKAVFPAAYRDAPVLSGAGS
jgi:peptide-methionine (S)-S-oxide reductase